MKISDNPVELLGGPQDGLVIKTDNDTYDIPVVEPVRIATADEASMMPKRSAFHYRRTYRVNKMMFEGIVER